MRLFIATSFPLEVLTDLNDRVARVKPRLPPASWVRPETQHVTFAFLGDQPESLVASLANPLEDSLRGVQTFEATLTGCGVFPNPRHARVGWVGLQPENKFIAIANAVRGVIAKNGVELDRADFKPHLTMMRMREGWPPASIEMFCRSLRDYTSAPFTVDKITLYSSQLDPKGAIHTPLRAFSLSA
jgi:RNA 2',3'-cyclic 3'-phosphodiesterase